MYNEIYALGKRVAIITHKSLLEYNEIDGDVFTFPSGEKFKTRKTKEKLEDALLAKGHGKDTVIVGFGGGVVCDMAGFLASTFCRGVPLVLIPTTLLAMVDASVGGKNGVNTPLGKNLIGTFYKPHLTIYNPQFLMTLDAQELRNGMAEIIKAGAVASEDIFQMIENQSDIIDLIERSIQVKKQIIEDDFYDNGKRQILNFGHTVGHAFEQIMKYEVPHGEAVRFGMVCEAKMGGLYDPRFEALVDPLPFYAPVDLLIDAMKRDKKCVNGKPRITTLEKIGTVKEVSAEIPEDVMREVISAQCAKAPAF